VGKQIRERSPGTLLDLDGQVFVVDPLSEIHEEIDRHMKEFSQPFRLRFADGTPATDHFRRSALVTKNGPDILVLQSTLFHQRI
jgi:hypothetical protein